MDNLDPTDDIVPVPNWWVSELLVNCCKTQTEVNWPTAEANHVEILSEALQIMMKKLLLELIILFYKHRLFGTVLQRIL